MDPRGALGAAGGLVFSGDSAAQEVLGGILSERGMISCAGQLGPEDSDAIRAYVIARAHAAREAPSVGAGAAPGQ